MERDYTNEIYPHVCCGYGEEGEESEAEEE